MKQNIKFTIEKENKQKKKERKKGIKSTTESSSSSSFSSSFYISHQNDFVCVSLSFLSRSRYLELLSISLALSSRVFFPGFLLLNDVSLRSAHCKFERHREAHAESPKIVQGVIKMRIEREKKKETNKKKGKQIVERGCSLEKEREAK